MTIATRVSGKFLEVDGSRFLVKGVAYGTFAPDASGVQFPGLVRVDEDFAMMASAGINMVRTYTVPSVAILDTAARHGLRVMVGMPWSQHIAFLDDAALTRHVRASAADTVRHLASHPASLLFAVGNEIPPAVVRWHGQARIERFLRDVYDAAKNAAPEALLTYVNFPPTEHLDVGCFDVCAFNVYLHREADLRAYLGRLQHLAGQKPLLLAEAGADSLREGAEGQARLTSQQLRAAFAEGAAGAVAFSWTDEWWRGGHAVDDWAFGLVDAERRPKPALDAVAQAFAESPFADVERASWPTVSVVVCAFNAADTIGDCLTSLHTLTYPRVEIVVVDDGSVDATAEIARGYPAVSVVSGPNRGLSAARNLGLAHATGDIVAYTDADVRVDPDWLTYLVQPMLHSAVVGSGGPNVVPHDDPWVAQCVARAPGGPTHVLLDDRIAEHVPGCNMAFRRDALEAVGGFNPVYLRAGDDVDVCWRLQAEGLTIGFAPSALVWHHHRATVKGYWIQQAGYGEGESWLDAHHPEKFVSGQMLWRGRIYSPLPFVRALSGRRINTGVWGTAAFPSVYSTDCHPLQFLPHSPAWMVTSTILALSGALGLLTHPGEAAWLLLAAGLAGWAATIGRCAVFATRSDLSGLPPVGSCSPGQSRVLSRALIAWLHLIQPIARMHGRVRGLLSPPQVAASAHVASVPWKGPAPSLWSAVTSARLQVGGTAEWSFWSESWIAHSTLLTMLVAMLRASRPARRVDTDDGWHADRDLSMALGRWGWLHVRALVEEHADGRCLCRVGARLQPSVRGIVEALLLAAVLVSATSAAIALRWPLASVAAITAFGALFVGAAWQTTRSVAVLDRALARVTAQSGMVPLPSQANGSTLTWRPSTALRKGQAALMIGVVATSVVASGLFLSRNLAIRLESSAPLRDEVHAADAVTTGPAARGVSTATVRTQVVAGTPTSARQPATSQNRRASADVSSDGSRRVRASGTNGDVRLDGRPLRPNDAQERAVGRAGNLPAAPRRTPKRTA